MPIDYPTEFGVLQEEAENVYRLVVHLAVAVQKLREHMDDLEKRNAPATCRHMNPIGDYCAYCQETPEG